MKKLLLFITILSFSFSFVGCSKDDGDDEKNRSIVGTWVNHYYEVGENLNESIKSSYFWEFNDDGNCEFWWTKGAEMWKKEPVYYKYKYYPEEKKIHLTELRWDGTYEEEVDYLFVQNLTDDKFVYKYEEDKEDIECERRSKFVEKMGGYNPKDIIGTWKYASATWSGSSYEFLDDKNGIYHYTGTGIGNEYSSEFKYSIDPSKNEIVFTYPSEDEEVFRLLEITRDHIYMSLDDSSGLTNYVKYMKQ